jgi:hypothetical protein
MNLIKIKHCSVIIIYNLQTKNKNSVACIQRIVTLASSYAHPLGSHSMLSWPHIPGTRGKFGRGSIYTPNDVMDFASFITFAQTHLTSSTEGLSCVLITTKPKAL